MIRRFREKDLTSIMQIWIDTNVKSHSFIPKEYWTDRYTMVEGILPQAEIYVYEHDGSHQIDGFIGLTGNYIAGIFVKEAAQSKGIGKQLLDYVKKIKPTLSLSVYQKNIRAVQFYQREQFIIQSEHIQFDTNEKELMMAWDK